MSRQLILVSGFDILSEQSFQLSAFLMVILGPLNPNLIDGYHILTGLNAQFLFLVTVLIFGRPSFEKPRGEGGDAHVAG
jgi:hypothetical protein